MKPARFQIAMAEHAAARLKEQRRFAIADEVGLGKTIIAARVTEILSRKKERFKTIYLTSNKRLSLQNKPALLELLPRFNTDIDESADDRVLTWAAHARHRARLQVLAWSVETSFSLAGPGTRAEREMIHSAAGPFGACPQNHLGNNMEGRPPEVEPSFQALVRRALKASRQTSCDESRSACIRRTRRAIVDEIYQDEDYAPDLIICDEFQRYRSVLNQEDSVLRRLVAGKGKTMTLFLSATPLDVHLDGPALHDNADLLKELLEMVDPHAAEELLSRDGQSSLHAYFEDLTEYARTLRNNPNIAPPRDLLRLRDELSSRMTLLVGRRERAIHKDSLEIDEAWSWKNMPKAIAAMDRAWATTTASKVRRTPHSRGSWKSLWLSSREFPLGASDPSYAFSKPFVSRNGYLNRPGRALASELGELGEHWKLTALKKIAIGGLLRSDQGAKTCEPARLWIEPGEKIEEGCGKILIFAGWRAALREIVGLTAEKRSRGKPIFKKVPAWMSEPLLDGILINGPTHVYNEFIGTLKSASRQLKQGRRDRDWTSQTQDYNDWLMRLFAGVGLNKGDLLSDAFALYKATTDRTVNFPKSISEPPKLSPAFFRAIIQPLIHSRDADARYYPNRILPYALAFALSDCALPEEEGGKHSSLRPSTTALVKYLLRPIAQKLIQLDTRPGRSRIRIYRLKMAGYCRDHHLLETLIEYFDHLIPERGPDKLRKRIEGALACVEKSLDLDPAQILASRLTPTGQRGRHTVTNHAVHPFGLQTNESSGKKSSATADTNRRVAFNSPFFPFILAASQAGEEGLNFHSYCRTVVHWDVPADPAALIQREGRVYRYRCLALRNPHRNGLNAFRWPGDPTDLDDELPASFSSESARIDRRIFCLPLTEEYRRLERLKVRLGYFQVLVGSPDPRAYDKLFEDVLQDMPAESRDIALHKLTELRLKLTPGRTVI